MSTTSDRRPWLRLALALALAVCAGSGNARTQSRAIGASGDWPLKRGPAEGTSYQPVPAEIDTPAIVGRFRLQGGQPSWAVARDVTGDGSTELLVADGRGIGAWSLSGQNLWHYDDGVPIQLIAVADLDADGMPELVLAPEAQPLRIIAGATGSLLWSAPAGAVMYNTYVGRYLPDVPGQQLIHVANFGSGSAPGSRIVAFLFRFDGGAAAPQQQWATVVQRSTEENIRFVHHGHSVLGDADNDGQAELIVFVENGYVRLDPRTGAIIDSQDSIINAGRNYGSYAVEPAIAGGPPRVFVYGDLLEPHITVLDVTASPPLRLWQQRPAVYHVPAPGVVEVDGGAAREIVTSTWTDAVGWELRILDAGTGAIRHQQSDLYVQWVGDLDRDGIAEIIASVEIGRLPRQFSPVIVGSFAGGRWQERARFERAWLQGREGWPSFEPMLHGDATRGRSQDERRPLLLDWTGDGRLDLTFLHDETGDDSADSIVVIGCTTEACERRRTIPLAGAPNARVLELIAVPGSDPTVVVGAVGGQIRVMSAGSTAVATFATEQYWEYRQVAADVNGDGRNELIVEDASGVTALRYPSWAVQWHVPGRLLASAELDGHDGYETLVTQRIAGQMNISAIGATGNPVWSTSLPGLSTSRILNTVKDATVGRFTGRAGLDVYVAGRHTIPTGNGDTDRSWLLRGDTGRIVWFNDASDPALTLPSLGPGKEAGAVALDVTGDGADDILMVSQVDFVALDGSTGRILQAARVSGLLNAGTFTSFAAVGLANISGDSRPEIFVHRSNGLWGFLQQQPGGGLPLRSGWVQDRLASSAYIALADVDGDSVLDAVAPDTSLKVYDAVSGVLKHELPLPGPKAADGVVVIGRGGRPADIVVTSFSNITLARIEGGTPRVVWTIHIDGIEEAPAAADLDADGRSEMLALTTRGEVIVVGAATTVATVSPQIGPAAGGTPIVVTGTNFKPGATVMVGPNAATDVTVLSNTRLTARTPPGSPATTLLPDGMLGAVAVSVTNPGGGSAVTLASAFAYTCSYAVSPLTASVPSGGAALTFTVTTQSNASCGWSAASHVPFAAVAGSATGDGPGTVSITVANNPSAKQPRTGTLTIAGSNVVLSQAPIQNQAPFGVIDTPAVGAGTMSGSIAITGWAVDDGGVGRVHIWRDAVVGEAGPLVFVGNAVRVSGARPDVASAFANYPDTARAGWGYLLLSNVLPSQAGGIGNGTYTFHVFVDDTAGVTKPLGSRTIAVDNTGSGVPFGAIDTPAQGETVSGTIVNFGWALTPLPSSIDPSGVTISVLIDGQPIGSPTYSQFRSDIAALFPGLANSGASIGYLHIDTTRFGDGLHTIAWLVTDADGRASGIGSRFFTIANGTAQGAARAK